MSLWSAIWKRAPQGRDESRREEEYEVHTRQRKQALAAAIRDGWRCWLEDYPPPSGTVEIRYLLDDHVSFIRPCDMDPQTNVANLWWRPSNGEMIDVTPAPVGLLTIAQ